MIFARQASSIWPSASAVWVMVLVEGQVGAMMTCPSGHPIELCSYTIDPAGRVSPEVECKECDFRDEVTLVGWRMAA